MIKARAGDVLFFGLSERNLELLRKGRPIKVDLTDLDRSGSVIIFYGKTEEAIRDDLIDMVGPETKYKDSLKNQ